MSQTTKFIGFAALFLSVLTISSCKDEPASAQPEKRNIPQAESPLVVQIRKMLREEPQNENLLISAVDGLTWEKINKVFERELKIFEKERSEPLTRSKMLQVKMELRKTFHKAGTKAAMKQKEESLKSIEKTLKEMAEGEGLTKP